MPGWADYWREVCAPKLLEKKKELGRKLPEHVIASHVKKITGKPSTRGLVWRWLHGDREPFISQFFALCDKLELDPIAVLERPAPKRHPALQRGQKLTKSDTQKQRSATPR